VVRFQAVVKIRRSLINRLEKICLDICTGYCTNIRICNEVKEIMAVNIN